MRLIRRKPSVIDLELNMPAMVDIVFLLLIFFMCTSSLIQPEESMASQMTRPGSEKSSSSNERTVRIKVRAADNEPIFEIDKQIYKDFNVLMEKLKSRRDLFDIRIVIEGQSNVPFKHMVAVLDACYRVNVTNVAFSPKGVK